MGDKKKIPLNSLGIKIKEAREKLGISPEELSWKINDKKIDKKKIKNWEKGQEFPDLDDMYKLATHLDLNPNELLAIRNQIQDESQTEPVWFWRHLFDKIFQYSHPVVKFALQMVLGASAIYLALNMKDLMEKVASPSDPEQENLVVEVIQDSVEKYVYNNETNFQNTIYERKKESIEENKNQTYLEKSLKERAKKNIPTEYFNDIQTN